jgi:hypothetical protein
MKKIVVAAAVLTIGVAAGSSLATAATTKDPMCNLAKSQKNPVSWNAYYHCLGTQPKVAQARAQTPGPRVRSMRSPYCDMAKSQKNPVAWNAYYHCLNR